jgi:hypothetical protein
MTPLEIQEEMAKRVIAAANDLHLEGKDATATYGAIIEGIVVAIVSSFQTASPELEMAMHNAKRVSEMIITATANSFMAPAGETKQ